MPEGATLAKSKVANWGAARLPNSFCVPSMFDSLEVQVLFTTGWR
jgi:hypothetical protein